jgi:hypothetical protein
MPSSPRHIHERYDRKVTTPMFKHVRPLAAFAIMVLPFWLIVLAGLLSGVPRH